MERKTRMLAFMLLNVLFYALDLLIVYIRYFRAPENYIGIFDFSILYSFLFSLMAMIPAVMAYFTYYNSRMEQERMDYEGRIILITVFGLVLMIVAIFYPF